MKKKPIQSSRILYMIVALIGSVALWIYVRSEVNPYSDPWIYRIPVTFEGEDVLNEDRSLIVLSGADTTVDLHLYGKRLDTATLNRSNIQITVDLSTIRSAGTYSLDYDISFPDSISANAITVRERSPSSVQLTVGKLQTKSIPVKGSGGSPAEGYLAETMICDPEQITIRGPEDVVKTIDHAEVYLDRDNLERTVNATLDYVLVDADGNTVENDHIFCDVSQIDVELPIVATKEVPLTVELVDGSGATADDAYCTIEPKSIQISGDAELLKGINQISLGSIELAEVFVQATLPRTIVLPNDTQNLSGVDEAVISVELRGLDTRTIRTTDVYKRQHLHRGGRHHPRGRLLGWPGPPRRRGLDARPDREIRIKSIPARPVNTGRAIFLLDRLPRVCYAEEELSKNNNFGRRRFHAEMDLGGPQRGAGSAVRGGLPVE